MTSIVVVDYGIGNVFSVCNAIRKIGGEPELTGDPERIRKADRLLLPGVGAFARAMEALHSKRLAPAIREFVSSGKPFLGICIGMQVLMEESEEFGTHEGFGMICGRVQRIPDEDPRGQHLRVPHIGWAPLQQGKDATSWEDTPLASLETGRNAMYFVHSYHCVPTDPKHRIAYADYSGTEITAALKHDNIVGVQFHPERSGPAGQRFLHSFLNIAT